MVSGSSLHNIEEGLVFWHGITQKQNYNTVPDTPSGVKQKQSNEKEPQTSANENNTLPNDTLPNNQDETLSQEQKVNQENVKSIISSEKLFYIH